MASGGGGVIKKTGPARVEYESSSEENGNKRGRDGEQQETLNCVRQLEKKNKELEKRLNEANDRIERIEKDLQLKVKLREGRKMGDKSFLAEMKNMTDKSSVLRNKSKLRNITGQGVYVEFDMTKMEREIQAIIRNIAKEEKIRISAGRVDILVGGSVVTEYRSKFYDFMWGYRFATYVTFFLTEHESSLGISNILISQILKTHYVPVLLVITSIIAYILNISTRLYGDRQSLQRDIEVSVGIFADRPLSVLTNFKKMPYRGIMKLLLAAWLIASVTSDAYFNAVIKAYLTFGKSTTTYLHDLIERGYSFVLTPNDYDFLSTYCQHSSALFCQKIFNNLHYSDNVCENLIKPRHAIVMDGIMALLFTVSSKFKYFIYTDRQKKWPSYKFPKLKSH
uniref:Uncharacterized protein LOC114340307 n=1 Tax=Diabrotica virgifera virgifera TaxID=50390 RepID=A0A6P7GLN0_DIAVI